MSLDRWFMHRAAGSQHTDRLMYNAITVATATLHVMRSLQALQHVQSGLTIAAGMTSQSYCVPFDAGGVQGVQECNT
jgi:hypothetical protein